MTENAPAVIETETTEEKDPRRFYQTKRFKTAVALAVIAVGGAAFVAWEKKADWNFPEDAEKIDAECVNEPDPTL